MGWADVSKSSRPHVGEPRKWRVGDHVCCIDDPRHVGIVRPSHGEIALVYWFDSKWHEEVHVDLLMRAAA
jgi:hypothetical protein